MSDPKIPITLQEMGERILRRRQEYEAEHGHPIPEMPRNAGKNRTESKKALLKAIEDAGGKW